MEVMSIAKFSYQTVRRLALFSFNSAARTKPHLVRDHLVVLLPNLYKETFVNPLLIRTVQMGPWTHKVDDGLETRKIAYETMYTLVSLFCNSKGVTLILYFLA
jgi:cullin-associated NEDD8-dissociated protein 1